MLHLSLAGRWQDGASSACWDAQLRLADGTASLWVADQCQFSAPLSELSITPRLGRTPRYIRFANHPGQLETTEQEPASQLDALIGSKALRFIHQIEQRLTAVAIATLFVLACAGLYLAVGIPQGARLLAHQLPSTLLNQASRETLLLLEKRFLGDSSLSEARQAEIRQLIAQAAPDYALEQLRFYQGNDMGANAFALPDGSIVFTDELVALAATDAELLAVFGHELGHIEHRHALRQIIQGSAISLTIALVAGDVSALGDLVLTAPVVFAQLAFSRDFELEADAHAAALLRAQGLDTSAFASILTKIHQSHGDCAEQDPCTANTEQESDTPRVWDYLRTHPHLTERINALEAK